MKPALPVIVEDLISKVTNSKMHPEQRQHYAKTLEDIVAEAQKALKTYEMHRNFRR
jgi:superoxide dismutase